MKWIVICTAAFAVSTGSITAASATELAGAGASSPYPALSAWAEKYQQKTGTKVNYMSIGSGGGVTQIKTKAVDFGVTDAPLTYRALAANNLIQFPILALPVVPVVNMPGIKSGDLVLDGPTLANIFLGKITRWNDAMIAKLNPRVELPDIAIFVFPPYGASGTSLAFTRFLSDTSPEWKAEIGSATYVDWSIHSRCRYSGEVTGCVEETVGAISYGVYPYARPLKVAFVALDNAAGHRIVATPKTFQSAVVHADFSMIEDYPLTLINQLGDKSWPIVMTSFVLMRTDLDPAKNREILKFFDYGLTEGAPDAEKLEYVTFPPRVVRQIEASWTETLKVWP